VEFLANVSVIVYVLGKLGIVKFPKPQVNVVESANETWSTAGQFLGNAAGIAKQLNKAFSEAEEKEKAAE
jgi:hypothetical protein